MKKLYEFALPNKLPKNYFKRYKKSVKEKLKIALDKLNDPTIKKDIIAPLTGLPLGPNRQTLSFLVEDDSSKIIFLLTEQKLKEKSRYYYIGHSAISPLIIAPSNGKKFHIWKIQETILHHNYIGMGFGAKIYDYFISSMGLILMSDFSLSLGAQKLWEKIISNKEKYATFIYDGVFKTLTPTELLDNYYLPDGTYIFDDLRTVILAVKKGSQFERQLREEQDIDI